MGRVIPFYVPEGFRSKVKRTLSPQVDRVVEFHIPPSTKSFESTKYFQPTWVFPEVDADLAVGKE